MTQLRDGQGIYFYKKGHKYEGNWKENHKCGVGKMEFKKKGVYFGWGRFDGRVLPAQPAARRGRVHVRERRLVLGHLEARAEERQRHVPVQGERHEGPVAFKGRLTAAGPRGTARRAGGFWPTGSTTREASPTISPTERVGSGLMQASGSLPTGMSVMVTTFRRIKRMTSRRRKKKRR